MHSIHRLAQTQPHVQSDRLRVHDLDSWQQRCNRRHHRQVQPAIAPGVKLMQRRSGFAGTSFRDQQS
jgi:hypothetical protein